MTCFYDCFFDASSRNDFAYRFLCPTTMNQGSKHSISRQIHVQGSFLLKKIEKKEKVKTKQNRKRKAPDASRRLNFAMFTSLVNIAGFERRDVSGTLKFGLSINRRVATLPYL